MSGDVQPRRRRDKKRKKEEQIEETIIHPQAPPTPTILPNDDTNIHVHKERTLGGGACAKCIFFVFMIVISVVIGITIIEHRGQTDVDIPASESRFASIFEGWIDKNLDTHDDDDDLHAGSEEISHEEEEEEEASENEASDEHDDDENEEEKSASDEESEAEESEQEVSEEEEEEEEEESVQEDEDSQENEEIDDVDDESQEDEDRSESRDEVSEEIEEDIVAEESEPDEQEVSDEQEISEEENDEKEDAHSEELEEAEEDDANKHYESPSQTVEIKDIEEDDQNDDNDLQEDDNPEINTANSVKSGTKGGAESDSDDDRNIGVTRRTRSGAQSTYDYENITNADDYVIRDDLDKAQRHLVDNIQLALSLFTKILESHPKSPRALYGKAQALDLWAEKKRSNEILQESIQTYLQVLNAHSTTPDVLYSIVGERCINRMRFIGNYGRAISVHKKLIDRFPNESKYKKELSVTYLTINKIPEARSVLIDILKRWPSDGFALVHYGFILKTVDNKLNEAVDYLRRGIETKEMGVIDGRFYFHLGDALARLGKPDEAMKIYEDGVANKVFLSKYQRSLYNVERLTARPWWNTEQTPYTSLYKQLELHYRQIRDEGLAVLNKKGYFKDESENLRDVGDWKQYELYARGMKHVENCKRCPITCSIMDSEADVKGCRRGQVKFSVMHPGTHVWPHCGPTNCRLRIHLGLKVPEKTYIRVAEETRTWEEGKIFIFDDSFEHEVWHNGTEFRLVLIVDIWHPELTKTEKYNLSAI